MRLTKDEEYTLFKEYKKTGCTKLRNNLIEPHYGIIMKYAGKYSKGDNTLRDELFQDGVIRVLRTLQDFDTKIGNRLVTFIAMCAEQAMKYTLNFHNYKKDIMSKRKCTMSVNIDLNLIEDVNNHIEVNAVKHDLLEHVKEYINSIPAVKKEAFLATYNYGTQKPLCKKYNLAAVTLRKYSNQVLCSLQARLA